MEKVDAVNKASSRDSFVPLLIKQEGGLKYWRVQGILSWRMERVNLETFGSFWRAANNWSKKSKLVDF